MRIPVVDVRGIPVMPCTPPKARALLNAGQARPKRNQLGIFYLQLTDAQDPHSQRLVVGIDPGSKFAGFRVVGTKATVCNLTVCKLMVEAPDHVKKAVKTRRVLRRARRLRLWRRAGRQQNRRSGQHRLPPSTRTRWEATARIVRQLLAILPLTEGVVEAVHAQTRPSPGRQWNASLSPVQVGKAHRAGLLRGMGLILPLREGWQTKQLRVQYGLTKTRQKDQRTFSSHAVDAWVLAASVRRAVAPTCTRLWYGVPVRRHRRQRHRRQRHRRQRHRLQADHGGVPTPYGGTRSLGFRRGTLVRHPRYGRCTMGGGDRARAAESPRLPDEPAADPSCQASGLSGAHGAGVSLAAGATAAPHPIQARAEDGASSPGLKAGVSAPHLDECRLGPSCKNSWRRVGPT
jgi:RRXRR protein